MQRSHDLESDFVWWNPPFAPNEIEEPAESVVSCGVDVETSIPGSRCQLHVITLISQKLGHQLLELPGVASTFAPGLS
jgi:hypothetical protein